VIAIGAAKEPRAIVGAVVLPLYIVVIILRGKVRAPTDVAICRRIIIGAGGIVVVGGKRVRAT
jgi:hypothetical protein